MHVRVRMLRCKEVVMRFAPIVQVVKAQLARP